MGLLVRDTSSLFRYAGRVSRVWGFGFIRRRVMGKERVGFY